MVYEVALTERAVLQPVRRVVRCVPEQYETYRYLLQVQINEAGPHLTVILKNPSTASATRSDPTIGKVEAWARRQGFSLVNYVNLFALRSTKPTGLNEYTYEQIVGSENDWHIEQVARECDTLVAAWGNSNGIHPDRYDRRIAEVLALLSQEHSRLKVVGPLTRQGYPRHGLLWNHGVGIMNFEF